MNNKSINNNPPTWEQNSEDFLKIFSLNCQSLRGKISHIMNDKIVTLGDLICLSETWLLSDENTDDIQIDGYVLCANVVGRGKGLATYFKQNIFHHSKDVKEKNYQLTKMSSEFVDVISVYRSQEGCIDRLLNTLSGVIDWQKTTLICGDFNVCYNQDRSNKLIATLENLGFKQLVQEATFIKGSLIDHVYLRECGTSIGVDCSLYSPYYCAMDHDALLTTVRKEQV